MWLIVMNARERETPQMHKYGESKTTQIMMATVCHITSDSGLRKPQAAWFLSDRVYLHIFNILKKSVPESSGRGFKIQLGKIQCH